MKKMRKAILSATVICPLYAVTSTTTAPRHHRTRILPNDSPTGGVRQLQGGKLFTTVKGNYIQLFKDALFDS